jgi:group I intron endonuclease
MIIYKITNLINGKIYIGQTIRPIEERMYEYAQQSKKLKGNSAIHRSIDKYKWKNFKYEVIDIGETINELNEKEKYYIKKFESNNRKYGYNIHDGGRNCKPGPETRKKMSDAHKGIKQSQEWISNRIHKAGSDEALKYGKIKTQEEKQYLSEHSPKYWKGKNRSEETKEKISKTKLNKNKINPLKELYKCVYKKNSKTGDLIQTYESTQIAGKLESVDQSTISRWCSNNKIKNEILWTYNK